MRFVAVDRDYRLVAENDTLLQFDGEGRRCRLTAPPEAAERVLRWSVPHLLLLQNQPVLHAAAVERDGRVIAFCGASGTGKTTLARVHVELGATLVSEDLLLLSLTEGRPHAWPGAEEKLRAWARQSCMQCDFDADHLRRVVHGPTLPLHEIWFLERERRHGDRLQHESLTPMDALAKLLANSFAELSQRDVWQGIFDVCTRLAESPIDFIDPVIPEGVDQLRACVRG